MNEKGPDVVAPKTVEQQLEPLLALLQQADGPTKSAIRNAISASGVVERA